MTAYAPRDLHYHVRFESPGCLPDMNEVYLTKKDALAEASRIVKEERADMGARCYGSQKDMFWQCQRTPHSAHNIVVDPCSDPACLIDEFGRDMRGY